MRGGHRKQAQAAAVRSCPAEELGLSWEGEAVPTGLKQESAVITSV